ncbi:hypothetical protein M5689_013368 [Euphorbia peplus]|nr:hypothetical protein M5689_013368 [Euphorbia peplus]
MGKSDCEEGNVTMGEEQTRGRKRATSRDILADLNFRLARVELAVADGQGKFDEMGVFLEELNMEEFRGEVLSSVDKAIAEGDDKDKMLEGRLRSEIATLRQDIEKIFAEFVATREELASTKEELALCKRAIAQGVSTSPISAPRLEVLKPKAYSGSRNSKEIDNFLWGLEKYFKAHGIMEDDAKTIDAVSLYLQDTAMVWWRMKEQEMQRGTCRINSWEDFKRKLKAQFYPGAGELKKRTRLRDYVYEFSNILLELPNYPIEEAFYLFVDGLQPWAKLEVQRRNATDLPTAMLIAEGLVEYDRSERSKSWMDKPRKNHQDEGPSMSGGEPRGNPHFHSNKPNYHQASTLQDKREKPSFSKERGTLKCFLCDGPHIARDCPKKSQLSAMIEREEQLEQEQEEAQMSSMQILNVIKTTDKTSRAQRKGLLFAEAEIGKHVVKALVDTEASGNFL